MEYTEALARWCMLNAVVKGPSFVLVASEPPETIVLAALIRRVPYAPSYAQTHACPTLCTARWGSDSKLTRPARLPGALTLGPRIEHGLGFTKREGWTRVRFVRVVIVGRSGIRVRERWRDAAGQVGEWRWGRTMGHLEELSWVSVIACSWGMFGDQCRG